MPPRRTPGHRSTICFFEEMMADWKGGRPALFFLGAGALVAVAVAVVVVFVGSSRSD